MSEFFTKPLKVIPIFYFLFLIPLCSATNVDADDFTATTVGDYGNITVMEVEGNYDARLSDGTLNEAPRQAIAKEFYRLHKDEYDFLVIFTNFDFQMPAHDTRAFYHPVKNDTKGIGQEIFDNSGLYGSDGRLQGIIDMGSISSMETNPLESDFDETLTDLSHELLHRWAAYVRFMDEDGNVSTALLGKDASHWSYLLDTDGSVLYGNDWQDNGDGSFTSVNTGKYYSPLDLYLMGFIDKNQVPPMLLIENPSIDPVQLPEKGVTITGQPRYITIDDIIAVEGERIPDASNSRKSFRMAFILATLPGTFRGDEVYELEVLRDEWITRFSTLTDGQGLIDVNVILKEKIPDNPGITPPETRPRTLPPDIEDGVNWLITHQEIDGSWTDLEQTTDRDTAEVVLALKNFELAKENYNRGLQWLEGVESGNMDYLSRKAEVFAEAGRDVTQIIEEILSRQNSDGGWGSNDSYTSNPMDTSFALSVLAVSGYTDSDAILKAIEYLKSEQNSDGGWGNDDEGSTIQVTTNVLMAFNRYRQEYHLDDWIERGIAWLLEHQNPDGGFGNSPSTVYDTALSVLALRELNVSTDITNRGLNYILSNQSGSGSWYESPYQTALAIKAVWKATVDPDLSIKSDDITFTPSTVTTLPSDVVISAVIWNLGRTEVPQARVVLYEGTINDASKVAEQVVAIAGQASTTVTFSVDIKDGNEHIYYIVVDPDGAVKESNEQNNSATKILYPEPTHDFEILSGDVSLSANTVNMFDNVTITSRITNRGTTDAYNVQLRYFIDDPDAPYETATLTMDIPAGTTITHEYTWKADRTGTNMPVTVEIDPFNTFTEISEDNNRATAYLTVEESTKPNLTVSYRDIVITPSPAEELGNATISVLIKNNGFSSASDVNVVFYKGTPGVDGVPLGTRTIGSLSPGETKEVSLQWENIMDSGERIIYVQVDPDNLITEVKEDDNNAFTTLKILSLPDLAISANSIEFSPSAPKEGDSVSINVTVKNLGQQDASDVTVNAYEGTALIGTEIIPLISGNAEAMVSFLYDTSGSKGIHKITIKIDPANLITERSKDNNQAFRVLGVQDADLWLSEPYISPNGDGVKDSTDFFFRLKTPQTVRVVVVDEKGRSVRVFDGDGLLNTRGGTVTWDGLDSEGMVVSDGQYRIEVVDMDGNILGSLLVVVDNNRSPLTEAIGTRYLLNNNLTCMLPQIGSDRWQWLPDESAIVFSIKSSNTNAPEYPAGVYTMAPDGEDILRLVPWDWTEENPLAQYSNFQSYLSPDGMKVLVSFSKSEGNNYGHELWMVDSRGEKMEYLLGSRYLIYNIAWSPDSRNIAAGQGGNLWIIDRKTLNKISIESDNDIYIYSPVWSPDGKRLAYIAGYYDQDWNYIEEIRITDLFGNKDVVSLTGWYVDIHWLGNDYIISIERDRHNYSNVMWLIKLNENGNRVKIADSLEEYALSPDKKQMSFIEVNSGNIYVKKIESNGNVSVLYTAPDYSFLIGEINSRNIQELLWSFDSGRISFIEYRPYEMIEGCPPFYAPYLIVVDILTMENKAFKMGEARCDYSYECAYSGKPECYIFPGEIFNGLETFLKDNIHLIAGDSKGYFVVDTETGENKGYILGNSRGVSVSPLGRYITYYKSVDQSSVCYGRGYQDIWAISSLLNLTAELRAKKEKEGIVLKGIAADLNFEGYELEYADIKNPEVWNPVAPPSEVPVVNDVFTTWVPPYEGRFYTRLTVRDRAGNMLQRVKQVSWGQFTSITNLYKTEEIFSPNGDGVKDTVELHYRVLSPVHLEFYIYDESNNLIRTFYRDYAYPVEDYIVWDGRDEGGNVVPDGVYKIRVFNYEFFVEVDSTPPDVDLLLSGLIDKDGVVRNYVTLEGRAVDDRIKGWVIEYAEKDNPEKWYEYEKGDYALLWSDQEGNVDPTKNIVINWWNKKDFEWLINKRFRITVEDYSGNKSSKVTGFLPEEIVVYKWEDFGSSPKSGVTEIVKCGDRMDVGISLFEGANLIETIRNEIASITIQYEKEGTWYDIRSISYPEPEEVVKVLFSLASGEIDKKYPVRIKAIDIKGTEYYSNSLLSN